MTAEATALSGDGLLQPDGELFYFRVLRGCMGFV